jgi:hypothetical protein
LFKETAKGNSLFDEAVTMSSLVSHRFKNSMFCSPENAMQATKYKNKNKRVSLDDNNNNKISLKKITKNYEKMMKKLKHIGTLRMKILRHYS